MAVWLVAAVVVDGVAGLISAGEGGWWWMVLVVVVDGSCGVLDG